MKKKVLIAIAFLLLPVTILTIAIIRRESSYQGIAVGECFEELKPGHTSPALIAIKKMGAAAVPILENALRSQDPFPQIKACWALQELGPVASDAVPDLVQTLDDDQSAPRVYAMEALTAIGTTRADLVPRMAAKLQDGNECCDAANLLDAIQRERTAKNLPPVYADEYEYAMLFVHAAWPSVRLRALPKLPLNDKRSMQAFEILLNDPNGWAREQTATFLKEHNIIITNTAGPIFNTPQR